MHNLTEWYFKPNSIERWRKGEIYKQLGILFFMKLTRYIGEVRGKDKKSENNYFIWDRSTKGLKSFEKKTRSNEVTHLMPTLLCLIGSIEIWSREGGHKTIFIIVVILFLANFYALMLQRYNRVRLQSILS